MRLLTSTLLATIGASVALGGCYTGDLDPMEQQPKLKVYRSARFFDDERAMRPVVDGTVPRERDLSPAPKVTEELVALGHEKFNQICTPCHGFIGDGQGSVAHKMALRHPPSLHDARRRGLSSEWIFRVISEGYGLMPRFTTQLDANERWAVVAYVRALQRSQDVSYDSLPADLREELEHPKPKAMPEGGHEHGHGGHNGTGGGHGEGDNHGGSAASGEHSKEAP